MLLDIDQIKTTMEEITHARDYAGAIITTVYEPLLVMDNQLRVQTANRAFFEVFHLSQEQISNRSLYELDNGRWNLPIVSRLFDSLLRTPGQMQQIVMNLIINGAEAIGEGRGGRVHVKTWSEALSADDLRRKYSAGALSPGTYVILEVTDDGCGMDD